MLRGNREYNQIHQSLQEKISLMDIQDFNACEYFKDRIPKWKSLNPELLVIAPRTATVYQPLIKKVWELVYGQGTCPKIINIDPKNISSQENFKQYNRILIFDDSSSMVKNNPEPILYNQPKEDHTNSHYPSLQKIGDFIRENGGKEVWLDWGKKLWHPADEALIQRKLTEEGYKLVRPETKEQQKISLDRAKKMRELGELISELIINKVP